jgi:hypothetical protein
MVGPPEQAKNNATEMKLPFISYGHYEGRELVTKHVDSVLMLSGIDPNNDMQGSIRVHDLSNRGHVALFAP